MASLDVLGQSRHWAVISEPQQGREEKRKHGDEETSLFRDDSLPKPTYSWRMIEIRNSFLACHGRWVAVGSCGSGVTTAVVISNSIAIATAGRRGHSCGLALVDGAARMTWGSRERQLTAGSAAAVGSVVSHVGGLTVETFPLEHHGHEKTSLVRLLDCLDGCSKTTGTAEEDGVHVGFKPFCFLALN